MLAFTLWLLFICLIIGLIYRHFSNRAKEIKGRIDTFVREASQLNEQKDLYKLLQLHKALKQYGETFCVNRPWFNLYGYYVEAEWIVLGFAAELEQNLVSTARRGRAQSA